MHNCKKKLRKIEFLDVTGVVLTPSYHGKDCKGNGLHKDEHGNVIECCCDECDFLICCNCDEDYCDMCEDEECPIFKT